MSGMLGHAPRSAAAWSILVPVLAIALAAPVAFGANGLGPEEAAPAVAGPDVTPPVVLHHEVTDVTGRSAVIRWTTDERANKRVKWGWVRASQYMGRIDALTYEHAVTLRGLKPGRLYHYVIITADAAGNRTVVPGRFRSLPSPDVPTPPDPTPPPPDPTPTPDTTAPSFDWWDADVMDMPPMLMVDISWSVDEAASFVVDWGTTDSYGQQETVGGYETSGMVTLWSVDYDTTYHYRITATDEHGNSRSTADHTFSTPVGDTTGPVISDLVLVPGVTTATLTFTTDEFAGCDVSKYTWPDMHYFGYNYEYSGSAHTLVLTGLSPSTQYAFDLECEDESMNRTERMYWENPIFWTLPA